MNYLVQKDFKTLFVKFFLDNIGNSLKYVCNKINTDDD